MTPDEVCPETNRIAPLDSAVHLNVLVVDDDPATVLLIRESLERSKGVSVLTALNGQDAVEIAEREKPDIILMDLMMPVMDGLTACSMLCGNGVTHDIPVIILTARRDVATAVSCFQVGAINYITKPIDPSMLMSKILETLDRAAAQREASSRA